MNIPEKSAEIIAKARAIFEKIVAWVRHKLPFVQSAVAKLPQLIVRAASYGTGTLYVVAGVTIVGAIISLGVASNLGDLARENLKNAGDLRVYSQDIAKNATEAAGGNAAAFDALATAVKNFETHWKALQDNKVDLTNLSKVWTNVKDNAEAIAESKQVVTDLNQAIGKINAAVPDLQWNMEEVASVLVASQAPMDQITAASKQSLITERITSSTSMILLGGDNTIKGVNGFVSNSGQFSRVLGSMLGTSAQALGITKVTNEEAIGLLEDTEATYNSDVKPNVQIVIDNAPKFSRVQSSASDIFADSQTLLKEATALSDNFESTAGITWLKTLGAVLGLIGILSVVTVGYKSWQSARREKVQAEEREAEKDRQNKQNQAAIIRLLDELSDLADGDLTVAATVSEDFTGAIADSINFAIDQMRSLVSGINTTAVQVSSAAQETQATAIHLAEASEHQAQEIAGASAAVNEMAVSIDQVSTNAAESAAVAERSVAIANKGNEVVQNTIAGMDTIREQIQDTAKRIKRLGESSQEIGDIVSLINDIADQTNILALNAAIQAAMAGDAGRGFAVVADEVQRLAERSSAATKQIESLVKTIQQDTNAAVISMEQTTTEVVKGARLAQNAGVALEEIENVSKSLADLIQNISNAARQQAASAGHISNTMNVIQEITSQTSAGTNATATSIGTLAELAIRMRESVAGFKLPDNAV